MKYLVLFWVNTSSQEGSLPAVNILLSVTCQFNLTQVFVHIPVKKTCTNFDISKKTNPSITVMIIVD